MTTPERFGRYRVTGTLGEGAMGEVYAAIDDVLGREVAIKVLKPQRNELAARMLDERFRQEARAVAALSHPNVVAVFDIGFDADPPYLVLERVPGPSLRDQIASGPLSESDVRALGIQIARALAAAHDRNIVHRDVKPANILVAGAGTWKLADFGVAHVPDSSLTMTGQFVGSPAYAPPEALLRGQSDREGDVFGLGATLYHAATGQWPRLEATTGALLAPLPPVRSIAPQLSEPLARAIDRAIAMEPAERPLANALAHELAHSIASEVAASVISPAPLASARDSTSISGASGAMQPVGAPAAPTTWKPWAIGAAICLLVITLVATTRNASQPTPTRPATTSAPRGPASPPPSGPLQIADPPMTGGKAAKDWHKVLDQIDKGHYREARKKLADWERKYGASPETESLRTQLEERSDEERDPHDD